MENNNQNPFQENMILTKNGAYFAMFLVYKGSALYFASLDKVQVPRALQPAVASALSTQLKTNQFALKVDGVVETGQVIVTDGDKQRTYEVVMELCPTPKDDYWCVHSILEVVQ